MTHLGQRLSALIDGELDLAERDRVLLHMARCASCRDEVAALRMLKRRMNALGDAAAGAGLTGRLIGLRDTAPPGSMPPVDAAWPSPAGGWQAPGAGSLNSDSSDSNRAGRYFITGSLVLFLAGLGTAAIIAGGEPQARAPAPPITPSVDVLQVSHSFVSGQPTAVRPRHPAADPARTPRPDSDRSGSALP